MTHELRLRLATDIVVYHLEQNPTRRGRGFYIGTIGEMGQLVWKIFVDMEDAQLFCFDEFKSFTKKDPRPIIRRVIFTCLSVFAHRSVYSKNGFFVQS